MGISQTDLEYISWIYQRYLLNILDISCEYLGLWYISGICRVYLSYSSSLSHFYFLAISQVYPKQIQYQRHTISKSQAYLWHIMHRPQVYLGYSSGISKVYIRYILGITHVYLRHISDISQVYVCHISGINRVYLRHISSRKLDKGLCLSRTKNCADYDSRGFEPVTPVAGPATLRY